MKIENEKILLSATYNPQAITGLPADQQEMFKLFSRSLSIREVVQYFYSKGQLVSFLSMHDLIVKLLQQNVIANFSLKDYFLGAGKAHSEAGLFDKLAGKIIEMTSEKKVDKSKIKDIPFFRSLSPELLDIFMQNSSVVPVSAGVTFLQEGAK
jgi:hypothetical protein